jgi:NADH-quinone oxidoreductase subunit D
VLELDGEVIVKVVPHIGHLHRGVEKLAESKTYHQVIPLTDRLDYTNAMGNNLGYVLAVEKLLGIEVPQRAQYLRVMMAELQRIAAHLIWLGTHALDIGAMTLLFYNFREREEILKIFEEVAGGDSPHLYANWWSFKRPSRWDHRENQGFCSGLS